MSKWRMESPCVDCPFNKTGPGAHLRRSLEPGRMAEIKADLRRGAHFNCHKTTHETGNGKPKVCAGALEWQHERGLSSNYERVCERIEAMFADRKPPSGKISKC